MADTGARVALPKKGARIRVIGVTLEGHRLDFEGVVSGIEFRTDPPVLFVVSEGRTRQVVNLGYGAGWEPL